MLVGAKPEYAAFFEDMDGLNTAYDGNTISLTIIADSIDDYNNKKLVLDKTVESFVSGFDDETVVFIDSAARGANTATGGSADVRLSTMRKTQSQALRLAFFE